MEKKKVKPKRVIFCTLLSLCLMVTMAPLLPGQAVHATTGTATIDVSKLSVADEDNSAASATQSQWSYNGAFKTLSLGTTCGNYILKGANPDISVDTFGAEYTNITLSDVRITSVNSFSLLSNGGTIILEGFNILTGNIDVSKDTKIKGKGKLTVNGKKDASACYIGSNTNYLSILGKASVTFVGGAAGPAIYGTSNSQTILVGSDAKITIVNNSTSTEKHIFTRAEAFTNYKWKITGGTTSNNLTAKRISVSIEQGKRCTIQRVVKDKPPKTKIKKIAAGKKKMKVTWKKVANKHKVTKYQLRYKVKGTKKWQTKIVSAKKTSLIIKKLKKGEKYTVQVRSKNRVGWSKWSKAKTSKGIK